MCQEFKLGVDIDLLHRLSFGFAGGIGNSGSVCGAVAGAIMAIGLKRGRPDSMDEVLVELGLARELCRRFEAEMGTINCRELTGMDLTTEEGVQRFMASDRPGTICFPAVDTAYRLTVNLLQETP